MADLRRLGDVAARLRDAYAEVLDEELHGDIPKDKNTRLPIAYVAAGATIAFDLPGIVVNFLGIRQGQPGQPVSTAWVTGQMNQSCQFAVTLLRDSVTENDTGVIRDGGQPTVEALSGDGLQQGIDFSAMWLASLEIKDSYSIAGPGEGFVLLGVDSIVNEGGMFGTRATLDVSVQ